MSPAGNRPGFCHRTCKADCGRIHAEGRALKILHCYSVLYCIYIVYGILAYSHSEDRRVWKQESYPADSATDFDKGATARDINGFGVDALKLQSCTPFGGKGT